MGGASGKIARLITEKRKCSEVSVKAADSETEQLFYNDHDLIRRELLLVLLVTPAGIHCEVIILEHPFKSEVDALSSFIFHLK